MVAVVGIPIAILSRKAGIERSARPMITLGGIVGALVELAIILLTYGTPSSAFDTGQLLYFMMIGVVVGVIVGFAWAKLQRTNGADN